MSIVDQVRRALGASATPDLGRADADRQVLLDGLRRELERIQRQAPPPSTTPVESPLGSVEMPASVDPEGMLFRHDFEPGHAFGRCAVERPSLELMILLEHLLVLEAGSRWQIDETSPLLPEELLFLDLETTGLSRSAGTLPFLTGVGAWIGGRFRVDQLLLQEPCQEPLALERLRAYLNRARVLVSFNGRGFDVPVLRNRDLIIQAGLQIDHWCHLDLLPPCRRLFRPRVVNCRLGTMERTLLGFRRKDDVEGSEAPRIYNDFLRTRHTDEMALVLEHNKLDVALMAPLLNLVIRHAMDPLHWAEDGEELLGAARMHLESDLVLAKACLTRGLELTKVPSSRRRLISTLARHLRRWGDPHRASALWDQYRREFPEHDTGWIELAKYHEHVTKDLPRALELAERVPARHKEEHQHRILRLRRRVTRAKEAESRSRSRKRKAG